MKLLKKWSTILVLVLTVTLVIPVPSQLSNITVAQAATVKISQKTLALEVGKSKTLKVSGTNKKVTWTSSKKSVAVVSTKGKVTAKKEGNTIITATVNKKKYTCKVTVKKAKTQEVVNPYIKKAPFKAQETIYGNLKFIIPTTWKQETIAEENSSAILMFSEMADNPETGVSNIVFTCTQTNEKKPDYELVKSLLTEALTADLIVSQLAQQGITATVKDFVTSDCDIKLGKAFKVDYTVDIGTAVFTQTIYEIYIDNYNLEITITDIGDELNPDVNAVADYLIETLEISK